jgi:hypothetical protein
VISRGERKRERKVSGRRERMYVLVCKDYEPNYAYSDVVLPLRSSLLCSMNIYV